MKLRRGDKLDKLSEKEEKETDISTFYAAVFVVAFCGGMVFLIKEMWLEVIMFFGLFVVTGCLSVIGSTRLPKDYLDIPEFLPQYTSMFWRSLILFIVGIPLIVCHLWIYILWLIIASIIIHILFFPLKGELIDGHGGDYMNEGMKRFVIAALIACLTAGPAFYYTWGLYKESIYLPWVVMLYIIVFTSLLLVIMRVAESLFK